ncbi:hypothetical protein [Roseomonas sp. USHLN139]|uniref:hypothetical protein n=1 Tax=Roseomonas sp. USHLN139 TaxID=3081298 RepID=UPI003B016F56
MSEPETRLLKTELLVVELGQGCAVGGVLVAGAPCWFAWTPAGVIPRVFASRWAALAAVAHVMRCRWLELGETQLRDLDTLHLETLADVFVSKQPFLGSDRRLLLWTVVRRNTTAYLFETAGSGLATPVDHEWKAASEFATALLEGLGAPDPSDIQTGIPGL